MYIDPEINILIFSHVPDTFQIIFGRCQKCSNIIYVCIYNEALRENKCSVSRPAIENDDKAVMSH